MILILTILIVVLVLMVLFILKIRSDKKNQNEIDENVVNPVSNELPGINSNKAKIFTSSDYSSNCSDSSSNKAKIFTKAFIHGEARVYGSRMPPRPQPRMSSSRTSRSNPTSQNLSQNSFCSNDEDDFLRRMRDQTILNEIIETNHHNSCCDPSSNCSDSSSYDCSSLDSGSCSCSD